jgi:hypothetical protein
MELSIPIYVIAGQLSLRNFIKLPSAQPKSIIVSMFSGR